jgi:hypothetical protein
LRNFSLANIGDALAHAFKFFYWKICCLYCEIKKRRKRLMRIQSVRMSRKSHRSSGNTMLSNNLGPNNSSIHASFKARPPSSATLKSQESKLPNTHHLPTLITISDGASPTPSPSHEVDMPPAEMAATTSSEPSSDVTAATATLSAPHETIINFSIDADFRKLPPMAVDDEDAEGVEDDRLMVVISNQVDKRKMSVCNMEPESIDGIDYVDETPQPSPTHLSPDENTQVIIHDVQDEESHIGDFEPRYEKVSVPVYICLLVVFGYIIGGSILFASWEGWNLLDGAYFW